MTRQEITYYPDKIHIKQYKEFYNGELVSNFQYDINGFVTLEETPERWRIYEYDSNGKLLYDLDSNGYFCEKYINKNNEEALWVSRFNNNLERINSKGEVINDTTPKHTILKRPKNLRISI